MLMIGFAYIICVVDEDDYCFVYSFEIYLRLKYQSFGGIQYCWCQFAEIVWWETTLLGIG